MGEPDSIQTIEELLEKIRSYWPKADLSIVEKAYAISEKAHQGQFRRSGEPYISHPLSVAGILADLHLDLDSVVTGILHDTVEDTYITLQKIREEFGDTIAELVDGVTKISQIKFKNSHEKQGENIRKMIVAMGKDVRVVMVKLADRMHNMRTLHHMPYEKQSRIALETLEIYSPLASRIGMNAMKIELEDLCFKFYRPDSFYELDQKTKKNEMERSRFIEGVARQIDEVLGKANVKGVVSGRAKHLWSVYRKMQARNIEFEQVFDLLAFRLIVENVSDCYAALGQIHSIWKPIPGRFKDFIAMPKANNYQSLHTTVVGPEGERIEIQIRTREMHEIAEKGIAAHWKYKERGKITDETSQQAVWLRQLVEWHQTMRSPEEFLETVKTDLFESEIYVLTPKGEVREFPDGSTPIDFAYAIHTQLGNQIVGARVNGKMVPLKYQLQNGDTVEIMTSKTQLPSKDWLKFVVTNKAKAKIRQFVKEEQRKHSQLIGKEVIEKEFRKFGQSHLKYFKGEKFDELLKDFGLHSIDELYIRLGYGRIEPKTISERLYSGQTATEQTRAEPTFMEKVVKSASAKSKKMHSLISVDGMDDILVHFAKCCHPIPGDPVVGFISRGRGVTVHRSDCHKAFEMDQMRTVDVAWTVKQAAVGQERAVRLRVISQDVPGLLKSMSEAFAVQGINIDSAQVRTTKENRAVCTFEISVRDHNQLQQAILELQKIRGVIGVNRI